MYGLLSTGCVSSIKERNQEDLEQEIVVRYVSDKTSNKNTVKVMRDALEETARAVASAYGIPLNNTEKELECHNKVTSPEDIQAMYSLGLMYANGYRVIKNNQKAILWYKQAAHKGSGGAAYQLYLLYNQGDTDIQQDSEKAEYWRSIYDSIKNVKE